MRLAVIPARGGSKRIPRKNIRPFLDKPMIAWSIEAALQSGCFDQVIVSSDDEEILSVARSAGAMTPFVRPAEISDDHATMREVLDHALRWFAEQGEFATLLACVMATAPTLTGPRIAEVIQALETSGHRQAFLVCEFGYPVQRGFTLDRHGAPSMLFKEHLKTRSQDLPPVFHDAGQFYAIRSPDPAAGVPPFLGAGSLAVPVASWLVQDIDTEDDWRRAELMMRVLLQDGAL